MLLRTRQEGGVSFVLSSALGEVSRHSPGSESRLSYPLNPTLFPHSSLIPLCWFCAGFELECPSACSLGRQRSIKQRSHQVPSCGIRGSGQPVRISQAVDPRCHWMDHSLLAWPLPDPPMMENPGLQPRPGILDKTRSCCHPGMSYLDFCPAVDLGLVEKGPERTCLDAQL